MGALKIFGTPSLRPRLLFLLVYFSWAFVVTDPMNVCTKFKVRIALPVPEIMWGTQKMWQSLDMPTFPFLKNF